MGEQPSTSVRQSAEMGTERQSCVVLMGTSLGKPALRGRIQRQGCWVWGTPAFKEVEGRTGDKNVLRKEGGKWAIQM